MQLMPTRIYDWKRFWCPRDAIVHLSDNGFLPNPEEEFASYVNPSIQTFESIAGNPCLVLVGEPGSGKSHSLRAAFQELKTKGLAEEARALFLDLGSYGNEQRLVNDLFGSAAVRSCLQENHYVHVYLDSLDECQLEIRQVGKILGAEFEKLPVERVHLRIACRTADWPPGLESDLKALWGEESLGVFELMYLRRLDVEQAAQANGFDPNTFIQELRQKEAVPLATKPLTLNFLLDIYKKTNSLPGKKSELYRQGCRNLCEETSQPRRDRGETGDHSPGQRLMTAARIAAITMFGNRPAIWTGPEQQIQLHEDLATSDLIGGSEQEHGSNFEISDSVIKEALGTGLFSARGPERLGWAHQTYAEFLAAWYLAQHRLPLKQLLPFVTHPADHRVIPQLHETAAWLASLNADVFEALMDCDPQVLLRSDVATAQTKDREALVARLLELFEEEKISDSDLDLRSRYPKLGHPRLGDQLRPYIVDKTKGFLVRRVAVDIAEACELQNLEHELISIVLGDTEPYHARVNAAYAVHRIADNQTKQKLRPLALGEGGDDRDDELKGCALLALWPDLISAQSVFESLTFPSTNLIGAYHQFIVRLRDTLRPDDLAPALRWVERRHSQNRGVADPFRDLEDRILLLAWEGLREPEIAKATGKALAAKFEHDFEVLSSRHDNSFRERASQDEGRRRLLLPVLVPLVSELACFRIAQNGLATSEDLPWVLKELTTEEDGNVQALWAKLAGWIFNRQDSYHLKLVYDTGQSSQVLAREFEWLLKPVQLDSPTAEKMRRYYEQEQEREAEKSSRPSLEPPPAGRISELLDRCESGDVSAFWRLNLEMTVGADGLFQASEGESDLTVLPGWAASDDENRARITEAAKRYLLEGDPATAEWLGTGKQDRRAMAGYRALRLMAAQDPAFLSGVGPEVWKKWVPTIFVFRQSGDAAAAQRTLVNQGYSHAAEEIRRALKVLIASESQPHQTVFVTRLILDCWDTKLERLLLDEVRAGHLNPSCMAALIKILLEKGSEESKEYVKALLSKPLPEAPESRQRLLLAANELAPCANESDWPVLWSVICSDSEFGRDLVPLLSSGADWGESKFGDWLTERQLADLYIWISREFPHDEYAEPKEGGRVTASQSLAMFRDSVLHRLKRRGTWEGCAEIRRICQEFPKLKWLHWNLLEAESNARQDTWVPPTPSQILDVVRQRHVRLVRDGLELLEVVVESLQRLQEKLHAETPEVPLLWNTIRSGVYRPKDENTLSDYVKNRLEEELKGRGIIANREVEVHRVAEGAHGQRTDIHVDAIAQSQDGQSHDRLTVIIETKGCWHAELPTAMKTQLLERYLTENQCTHGLYLVGWFNCEKWDDNDHRKKRAPNWGLEQVRKRFEKQAAELSEGPLQVKAYVLDTALR